MEKTAACDELLLQVAAKSGNIEDVLESIFGFFERRTDLFHVMTAPDDHRGFSPGRAEKMVMDSFKAHASRYAARSPVVEAPKIAPPVSVSNNTGHNMSTHNGGVTDRYSWTQTESDLSIECLLPILVEDKKDLAVKLSTTGLAVLAKGAVCLEGTFHERIDVAESTWTIEDRRCLTFVITKSAARWWTRVFVGDAEIDGSKIESKKRVDQYDPETQSAIRKIVADETLKRQGLPTSDQVSVMDKLKAAWDTEGSPFKGTPFDPSLVGLS